MTDIPIDAALGGLVAAAASAVLFIICWKLTARTGLAGSLSFALGYAAGAALLEFRSAGAAGIMQLLRPHEAHQGLAWIGLGAAAAVLIAEGVRQRRILALLAVPVCIAAPLWLLWGGKYLPSREVRESGFAKNAWGPAEAALILGAVAAAMLATWWSWNKAESPAAPRMRWLLCVIAMAAASVAAGLTGSFTYAQHLGLLAGSAAGALAAVALLRLPAGPEASAGPAVVLTGSLLLLASAYSELRVWQAGMLGVAMLVAAGVLPSPNRLGLRGQTALRILLCIGLVGVVVAKAGVDFAASQRQQQQEAAENPYLNL